MNDIPVFPLKDPQAFYEQLATGKPDPKTGKPDPAAMQAFLSTPSRDGEGAGFDQGAAFLLGLRQRDLQCV